jgi:hypothetical protein
LALAQRGATPLTCKQWQTPMPQNSGGAETGRPRMRFVVIAEMLAAAR